MKKVAHIENLFPGIHDYAERAIQWRNHIHRHPELSFEENETASFVEKILQDAGFTNIRRMAGTGVVASLHQSDNIPCIALRADLDALPICESAKNKIRSKNDGIMHACGHDAHTACLLAAAHFLIKEKNQLKINVKFIFQPGEEKLPGGASLMMNEGVLDNPEVMAIYGLHVTPDLQTGSFGLRAGPFMASTDELHIKIIGKAGHAAMFGTYVNPVYAGSVLVSQCMDEVTKKFSGIGSDYVLAFGDFHAHGATNVIAAEASLKGTLRTFSEDTRASIHSFLLQQSESIARTTGAKIEFDIRRGYPVLINDENLTKKTEESLSAISHNQQVIKLNRRMTAEDFAWYSQKVPSCFIRWGTGNTEKGISSSVHTPEFEIDEDAMVYGIAALLQCVIQHQ